MECPLLYLTATALAHLSRSHDLHTLKFQVHDWVVHQLSSAGPSNTTLFIFPTLRELSLGSASLPVISTLLRYFRLPMIHQLHVRPQPQDLTFPKLVSFISHLPKICIENSLVDLSLVLDDDSGGPDLTSEEQCYIDFETLYPLTYFADLKELTIDLAYGVNLNNAEILSLASSWPSLETFEVGKKYEWTDGSGITPGGFFQLLEKCKSLKKICFKLDARGYTEIPQGHPWQDHTMSSLASIHLLHSPIEETSIDALAVFFHVFFRPDFKLATYWETDDDDDFAFRGREPPEELCALYHDRWRSVRLLARDLWMNRRT